MLYERWREIARERPQDLALRDLVAGTSWTFAELDAAAATPPEGAVVFPQGNTAAFVIEVLRGWRHGRVVCPLEPQQPGPAFPPPPPRIAHLKFTSATSGAPKLVAFTAEQLAADADNIVATMDLRRDSPNLGFISLAHSYGFSNLVTPLLLRGIPLFVGGTPLPEAVRRAVADGGAVTLPAVPALWRVWHQAGIISPAIRLAISAGAPLPIALEKEIFSRCGVKIHNFYGASECGGIAYDRSDTPRSDAACVGEPVRSVNLCINASRCLEVRGPNVGETYWPTAAPSLEGGVYRSTDLAELVDGRVWLRGRASDVINIAGRKIAPESIEQILATHPEVRECLVFGVPERDLQRGDTIVACVATIKPVRPESLRQFMLERSEAWQVPRDFWLVPSLETNQRGKLSRAEWRHRYLERSK